MVSFHSDISLPESIQGFDVICVNDHHDNSKNRNNIELMIKNNNSNTNNDNNDNNDHNDHNDSKCNITKISFGYTYSNVNRDIQYDDNNDNMVVNRIICANNNYC